jgi:hypothetical protein
MILEAQILELKDIQSLSTRISRLENKSFIFNKKLNNISINIIPNITTTLKKQSSFTSQLIEDSSSSQLQQEEQHRETQRRLNAQQQCIDNLNTMINSIINNQNVSQQTPNSRPRKKPRNQQSQNTTSITEHNQTNHIQQMKNTTMEDNSNDTNSTNPVQHSTSQTTQLQTQNQYNNQPQNTIESPNLNNSSQYTSLFNSQDMIVLSPIDNTSPQRTNLIQNIQNTIINLTSQSPHQHDNDIILPRNLSDSFPTPTHSVTKNQRKDLGNHSPGSNT